MAIELQELLNTFITFVKSEPNWLIAAFVGGLISLSARPLVGVATWPIRRLTKHWAEGIWYHHFFNFDTDTPVLKIEEWVVKKGILRRLIVKADPQISGEPQYRGHIVFEKEFLLIYLNSTTVGHSEAVVLRFPSRVPSTTLVGVSIATDYAGLASVGANVLSHERLDSQTVTNILQNKVQQNPQCRVMRIKKR